MLKVHAPHSSEVQTLRKVEHLFLTVGRLHGHAWMAKKIHKHNELLSLLFLTLLCSTLLLPFFHPPSLPLFFSHAFPPSLPPSLPFSGS